MTERLWRGFRPGAYDAGTATRRLAPHPASLGAGIQLSVSGRGLQPEEDILAPTILCGP